jgi:hypothetical protein
MTPTPTRPGIFDAASLEAASAAVLGQIQPDRTGILTVGATMQGARVEVGKRFGKDRFIIGGWAEKTWGGSGWNAGARAVLHF